MCDQRISRLEAAFDNVSQTFRMYAMTRAELVEEKCTMVEKIMNTDWRGWTEAMTNEDQFFPTRNDSPPQSAASLSMMP